MFWKQYFQYEKMEKEMERKKYVIHENKEKLSWDSNPPPHKKQQKRKRKKYFMDNTEFEDFFL